MSLEIADDYADELDETDRNRRESKVASKAAIVRKHSGRRRKIDPTTTDRQYTADELEFMKAMHAYILSSGRKFPTHSEYLEVARSLGYAKQQVIAAKEVKAIA